MFTVGSGWCCFFSSGYKRYKCLKEEAASFFLNEWLTKNPLAPRKAQGILMPGTAQQVQGNSGNVEF